jgi:hypothetical protein
MLATTQVMRCALCREVMCCRSVGTGVQRELTIRMSGGLFVP